MELDAKVNLLSSRIDEIEKKVFPNKRRKEIEDKIHTKTKEMMNELADKARAINESNISAEEKKKQIKELEGISRKEMKDKLDELEESLEVQ